MCAKAGEFVIDAVHRLRDELREGGAPGYIIYYLAQFETDVRKQLEAQKPGAPAPF